MTDAWLCVQGTRTHGGQLRGQQDDADGEESGELHQAVHGRGPRRCVALLRVGRHGGGKAAAGGDRGGVPAGAAAGARRRRRRAAAAARGGAVGRVRGALRAPLQPAVVAAEPGRGADGLVDLAALRRALGSPEYANHPMLLSFSACSNVTGVLTDTRAIARLLHQHGAFACFDFAARYVLYSLGACPRCIE